MARFSIAMRCSEIALWGRPTLQEGVGGYSERATRLRDGTRLMVGSRRHSIDGRPIVIRLAQSEEPVWRSVREFLLAAALIFPILVGAAAIAAHPDAGATDCESGAAHQLKQPA